MADAEQAAKNPAWFEEAGKAGQQEASDGEEGEQLALEDDGNGEELKEVSPVEVQSAEAVELKTKPQDEAAKKELRIPKDEKGNRRSPPWAKVPKGMRFPRGIDVLFAKIPAHCTMYPSRGDRQVILWALTDGDERMAYQRSSNAVRAAAELTKQMIRAIDGQVVNWTGDPGAPGVDIDQFWHEVGSKGRDLLQRLHIQMNTMNRDELTHFFEHCIAAVSTG